MYQRRCYGTCMPTTIKLNVVNNERPDICGPCGGRCCKALPGASHPGEWTSSQDIADALRTGQWSIDWFEGTVETKGENLPFLRPATKDGRGCVVDPSWGGECVFLGEAGCSRSWDERPVTCRLIEAQDDRKCDAGGSAGKLAQALVWERSDFDLFEIAESVEPGSTDVEAEQQDTPFGLFGGFMGLR